MPHKDLVVRKAYMKAHSAAHYQANKQERLDRNNMIRSAMRKFVNDLKSEPCMDCRQSFHTVCMDFDHRVPKDKVAEVGVLINRMSWFNLFEELDKCDLVCSNCHRIRTKAMGYGVLEA